jgi:hypothetical protein
MENSAVTGILQRLRPLAGWAMIGASMALSACGGAIPDAPCRTSLQHSTGFNRRASPMVNACPTLAQRRASPPPDQYYGAGCSTFNAVRLACRATINL